MSRLETSDPFTVDHPSNGFEQGYARATEYLLAALPALIERFDQEHIGMTPRDREVLRMFATFLEERLAEGVPPNPAT